MPASVSARTASRSELRLRPSRAARSASFGRRAPAASSPLMIIALIWSMADCVTLTGRSVYDPNIQCPQMGFRLSAKSSDDLLPSVAAKHPMFVRALETFDVRFPTSRDLDGSDARNPDPDYPPASGVIPTDASAGVGG